MNYKSIVEIFTKNKKVIVITIIGGVSIIVSFYAGIQIDREIKKRKLTHMQAVTEYRKYLNKVENELASEYLSKLQRVKLEKLRKHFKDKIQYHINKAEHMEG